MPEIVKRTKRLETPWFCITSKLVTGLEGAGDPQEFYVLEPPDYVTVIALTDEREVLLVRQYRAAVERYSLEFPSGTVDEGEEPADTARRELLEETGYCSRELELLGCTAPDTGRLGNRAWCYFAGDVRCSPGSTTRAEPGIELVRCSLDELAQHILAGRFDHAQNLAALLLAAAKGNLSVSSAGISRE